MSDDTRRRLEEAGRRPRPPPDPAFADATRGPPAGGRAAAAGRARAGDRRRPVVPALRSARSASPPGRRMGALAVAPGGGRRDRDPGPGRPAAALELAQPVNVEVALADGTMLEDPGRACALPEGAVITVGAGGYGPDRGQVVLGPVDVATIATGGHAGSSTPADRRASRARAPPRRRPTPAPRRPARRRPRPAAPTAQPARHARGRRRRRFARRDARPHARADPQPPRRATPADRHPRAAVPAIRTAAPPVRGCTRTGRRPRSILDRDAPRAASYVLIVDPFRASGPRRTPSTRDRASSVRSSRRARPRAPVPRARPGGRGRGSMVVALRRDGSVLRRSRIVAVTIPRGEATGPEELPRRRRPAPDGPQPRRRTAPDASAPDGRSTPAAGAGVASAAMESVPEPIRRRAAARAVARRATRGDPTRSRASSTRSAATATSPSARSRRRCSSRWSSAGRCSSRARPASARRSSPRCSRRRLGARLIRLQCYEGLDVNTAVYEWNYPRQMLEIRLLEARGEIDKASAHDIFGPEFLLKRPLLQALEATRRRRRRCC